MKFDNVGKRITKTILIVDHTDCGYTFPLHVEEHYKQIMELITIAFCDYEVIYTKAVSRKYIPCDYMLIHGLPKNNAPGLDREYFWEAHNNPNTMIVIGAGFISGSFSIPQDSNYFKKLKWTRGMAIGYGGWSGLGNYYNKNSKSDRWESWNIEIKNYNWSDKEPILLIGQSHDDSVFYKRKSFLEWVVDISEELGKYTDRPIHYKISPWQVTYYNKKSLGKVVLPKNLKFIESDEPFMDLIKNYYAMITYNSTSGCEAVLAGCPVYAYTRQSLVYDLAFHDILQIENITDYDEQDRLQWAYNLAYCQWSVDEIKQGLPHKHLGLI